LQQPARIHKIILNNLTAALLILLCWRLPGAAQPDSISGFHLNASDLLKFATEFGLAEASNETVETVRQLSAFGLKNSLNELIAFEENRHFVYALIKPSEVGAPGSPHLTRRLILLKPSTFVVDDEIEGSSSLGSAQWSLHSQARPSTVSRVATVRSNGTELISETLLPELAGLQVKHQPGYSLHVNPKQPSKTVRFLHVLHLRRTGDGSTARTQLMAQSNGLHLTIQASQQTYQLMLPKDYAEAGEIEISKGEAKGHLERRFFPAGVLPHGREGLKLLELWDGSYRGGKRPFWDAGLPSGELRRVVEQGLVRPGLAVDLGCGSGTDAIYLASKGFDVTAIDIAPTALSQAREKANRAGVKVRWLLANVLSLPNLLPFEFIFDRGCYHEVRFDNAAAYVETVRRLSQPERTRFLLLAGNPNEVPVQYAPPQVAEEDIRSDFSALFDFEWLKETRFETSNPAARGPLAWSVMLRRKTR